MNLQKNQEKGQLFSSIAFKYQTLAAMLPLYMIILCKISYTPILNFIELVKLNFF